MILTVKTKSLVFSSKTHFLFAPICVCTAFRAVIYHMENNSIKAALTFSRFVRAIMSSDCACKSRGRGEATKVLAKTRVGSCENSLRRIRRARERLARAVRLKHTAVARLVYVYTRCFRLFVMFVLNDYIVPRGLAADRIRHTAKKIKYEIHTYFG